MNRLKRLNAVQVFPSIRRCFAVHPVYPYKFHASVLPSTTVIDPLRNWKVTKTRKLKVTPAMRRKRAAEIAEKLNDADEWHSHGHGISMEVLKRKLNLEIEDYGKDIDLSRVIKNYWCLLIDFMRKLGTRGVIHVKGQYKPIMW